ncbi:MAG: RNA polymerase sigma-70 factor (ECF subfamily) [Planctomycetota bacterium]|jgi:RNA polymerase sigma-70 factor (ECF subfamily)
MDQENPEDIGEIIAQFETELRRIARGKMRNQPRSLMQTTALLNSACRRMIAANKDSSPEFDDEAHFLRVAAKTMRSVLTDYARKRQSIKRDKGVDQRPVEEIEANTGPNFVDRLLGILTISEIIEEQATVSPENAAIVELRYFGGLTLEETASAAGVGVKKVKLACAQLKRLLEHRDDS